MRTDMNDMMWRTFKTIVRLYIAVCFFLAVSMAYAAPFLICDPYPASQPQPTEFTVTFTSPGSSTPPVTVTSPPVAVAGGAALKLDLAPLNLKGVQTVTAKARGAWGESGASAPLSFATGIVAVPMNLSISVPAATTTGASQ